MKKQITPLIYLFTIILLSQVIIATEPTQQYGKLYLDPFYRESTTGNTNYEYSLIINPPDGISEIKTAIITFEAYLTPSVTFTLLVNGQSCNNPTYYISTTYAGAGQGTATFDCGNIITKAGNYNLTFKASKNTGAISGWLDLTYMNDPRGDMSIMGTEYQVGDRATIFLQLKDEQGFPENNAGCFVDIYYPEMINQTHPIYINKAPLMYKNGSEGLYYYDLNIPNVTGVYMLSATCSYSYGASFCYALAGDTDSPLINVIYGTYYGNTIFLNGFEDGIYTSCDSGGGKICEATYDYNLSTHFSDEQLQNITSIQLFYTGEANYPVPMTFSFYNWSSGTYNNLPNTLIYSGKSTTGSPVGINDFQSNTIPIEAMNTTTKIIRIRLNASRGVGFTKYDNWLNLKILTLEGNIHELKGNSEMHITSHDIEQLSWLEQIWDYIYGWLSDTINQIDFKIDLLLNASNITSQPITIIATTEDCITESDWIIQAKVTGNYGQTLDNNTVWCNITTNIWNESIMTYQPEGYFEYRNLCPEPADWNWSITCEELP